MEPWSKAGPSCVDTIKTWHPKCSVLMAGQPYLDYPKLFSNLFDFCEGDEAVEARSIISFYLEVRSGPSHGADCSNPQEATPQQFSCPSR